MQAPVETTREVPDLSHILRIGAGLVRIVLGWVDLRVRVPADSPLERRWADRWRGGQVSESLARPCSAPW